jgi:uncharacterized protein YuzE
VIQTTYDPEADAMSVWFTAPSITATTTEEVAPGVMLDFDSSGQVIGIEVLGVRRRSRAVEPAAPDNRLRNDGTLPPIVASALGPMSEAHSIGRRWALLLLQPACEDRQQQ